MGDEQAGQGQVKAKEQAGNSPQAVKEPSIISYNLREEERPGGLKVRFKVKAETGRKARETGARQAAAIRELLIWAHKRQNPMP